ncbi:MAG: hypothetical protein QOJ42_2093 [Acidobacteriaceae bacterium]|nr:hypothetical protein [Acidobacteriaceae bacterium]
MKRSQSLVFRLLIAALAVALLSSVTVRLQAQAPPPAPAAKAAPAAEEEEDPFAAEPATPLPPGMTGSTTDDPRVGLKPGIDGAGEAAMGIKHLAFLKKPTAFQLPSTQADDPVVQKTLDTLGVNKAKIPKPMQPVIAQLAFANSDFAFQGTHLFQGNFYGLNIYDISNPANISLSTSLVCPGGQGDPSVYGHLLFMSVEMPNGRLDCGTQGFPPLPPPEPGHEKDKRVPVASPDRFRGVRIFDISDIKNPKQVAAVQTCRGSHTHTLVVDPNDKENVYLYVSGTSFVRKSEELAGCSDEAPDKDPNTSLFRIDVIKVPLAAPEQAKIVSSPRVFIDPRTGALNGLNNGGSHDKKAEKPADTNQCHDITVYSAIGLAAGACSGNGILLDIKDPVHPKRVDAVNDPNYSYWHSASFSNDGTKVVFTDEWGGGLQPRCRPTDPNKWGADAIFNLKDDKLSLASYYKMPAAQTATENCVAHNGSLVPVPGRDIEVQAWYQGGISVVDFTDAAHPYEIAYFDRGPVDASSLILGGDWSAYWYNGYIYGSEIARGIDVFKLVPSKFLTQNEIDASDLVQLSEFNVQNQPKIAWPSHLVVARAYLDQLGRSQALPAKRLDALNKAVVRAQTSKLGKKDAARLQGMAASVEADAVGAKNGADAKRLHALAQILQSPTA